MKTVLLHGVKAAGRVAYVDDAEYERVMRHQWYLWERLLPNGSFSGPYARATIDGKRVLLHRFLLPDSSQVDHRDGDGLNCQLNNLRRATFVQNRANTGKRRTCGGKQLTSRYKGVCLHKPGIWKARCGGRYLGLFTEEEDAARAYDTAAMASWGLYARLNFPAG